jgi:hypothetical protein
MLRVGALMLAIVSCSDCRAEEVNVMEPDKLSAGASQQERHETTKDEAIAIARRYVDARDKSLAGMRAEAERRGNQWHVVFEADANVFGGGATVLIDAKSGEVVDAMRNQ